MNARILVLVAAVGLLHCARASTAVKPEKALVPMPLPEGSKLLTIAAGEFAAACDRDIATARQQIIVAKGLDPKKQGAAALEAYDAATSALSAAASRSGLTREVHPDGGLRDAARACEQKVEALGVTIAQDPALYQVLAGVDVATTDAATKYWLERVLLDFRRAGVDRDDATREKVKTLNEELVLLGQEFNRNIAEDVRSVELTPKELAGLPADYIQAHPPGKNGKVTITSNTPDYLPFMTYAKDGKAREKVWRMYRQRAHPKNLGVLQSLIAKRHELATLLGYKTWADYVMETKMTGAPKVASEFIYRVAELSRDRAQREYDELLARKKKDEPKATALEPWDQDYYQDRLKAERFGFDSQALRPWFEYARVKQGVMDITSRMFGIRFEPVPDVAVWHADVEAYDVREGETLLGRIYLDMHARADKYKHAAQFDLVIGQQHKRHPESVLVCNFPRPGQLMSHEEVTTFFHEFGHLLHFVFAGRQRWHGLTVVREWDFVETPSMLLQEWASQPSVLKEFARHHQTGEPLAPELIEKLRASREFGKGLWTRRQMFLAAVSLTYYSREPGFDTTAALIEQQKKFTPFRHEHREGTYFQAAFGHLEGYSAAYYTYVWSMVIAKDLETKFEKNGYLDTTTARQYRQLVLEPGGSKRAAELVQDFLGREYGFDAYRAYLERG